MKPYLLIAVCFLAGCGLTNSIRVPEWQAIDGSRADGTVTLSYEQSSSLQLAPRKGQDNEIARTRCRVWGYTSAEPFGGATRKCIATNQKGSCTIWQFEKRYQCTNHTSDKTPSATTQQPIQNNITIELSPTNLPQIKSQ